jgi:ceramide synthetase
MAKYANFQKISVVLFMMFAVVWIGSRLGVFPMWILYRCVRACLNCV